MLGQWFDLKGQLLDKSNLEHQMADLHETLFPARPESLTALGDGASRWTSPSNDRVTAFVNDT